MLQSLPIRRLPELHHLPPGLWLIPSGLLHRQSPAGSGSAELRCLPAAVFHLPAASLHRLPWPSRHPKSFWHLQAPAGQWPFHLPARLWHPQAHPVPHHKSGHISTGTGPLPSLPEYPGRCSPAPCIHQSNIPGFLRLPAGYSSGYRPPYQRPPAGPRQIRRPGHFLQRRCLCLLRDT